MSYIRYGEHGSSVYVYDQGDDAGCSEPVCSGCSFVAHSWSEIVGHLVGHRDRGDRIPDELMRALAHDPTLPTHPPGTSIWEDQ